MSYIYKGMLVKPTERTYEDGRDEVDVAIRKIHGAGPQTPDALENVERPTVANRQSVQTIKKALRKPHGIGRTAHMRVNLSGLEQTHDLQKGWDIPSAQWNAMTRQERQDYLRKLHKASTAKPRRLDPVTDNYGHGAPESSNSQWNDVHATTGATNDWHDQIAPATKPTRITFHQFGTPGRSSRDDAVEAIKQDLTKPKRMGASPNVDDSFTRER